ncbi:bifunctional riboflavin kinase/FAD synthetase [Niabella soli]|uniref:Riboflavin biosynthesis protein n=1 Tax=Niabella soli DSM 19437 TaxID=929713 RepID=W0EV84_9BACT|nr:bifunctional riboflavin kinase/FAD synthetase [Niabella soli]AHF14695.1 riboflavin biosynthesis protein RibF [Niabella soli DSM 19437]
MQIHRNIEALPAFRNAVITIGTFDGVHEGHRKVIKQIVDQANAVSGESVIITFHPHPRKVVNSSILGLRLITTLDERIELLGQLGVDHLVIIPFTEVFANQLPEDYLCDFLIEKFKPHTIVIGYDHRFGRDRLGDYKLLELLQEKYKYQLREIPKHVLDNISISSTKIREAILKGDAITAGHLLGYDFFFEGEVVHGDKLGRELGYPTANLHVKDEEKIIPGNGIYAVYVAVPGHAGLLKGMMSIGLRPTVNGKKRTVEVNIFDFDKDIYGTTIRVYVKQYLREELKFDSLEALVKQIDQDKIDSLAVL